MVDLNLGKGQAARLLRQVGIGNHSSHRRDSVHYRHLITLVCLIKSPWRGQIN
jgi:hypothetical protein